MKGQVEREAKAVEGGRRLAQQLRESTAMLERMDAEREQTERERMNRHALTDLLVDVLRERVADDVSIERYLTNTGLEQIRLTMDGVAYHVTVTKARS